MSVCLHRYSGPDSTLICSSLHQNNSIDNSSEVVIPDLHEGKREESWHSYMQVCPTNNFLTLS